MWTPFGLKERLDCISKCRWYHTEFHKIFLSFLDSNNLLQSDGYMLVKVVN